MGDKKLGRPPIEKPMLISLKLRLDEDTAQKLEECIAECKVSKAEIIRRGIQMYHKDLQSK